MPAPTLLRGTGAIAAHLGTTTRRASHLDRQRMLPTFRLPGDSAPHATGGGLDEWRQLAATAGLAEGLS